MITAQSFTRHDVSFTSGKDSCAAGLYLPTGVTSPPVVVLGHGLGATREMRLDAFVERFARAGIAALAFTYRHFGDSSGQPRQLLSIKRQLADWGRFGDARQSQRQPSPDHYRPGRLRHVTDSRAGSQDHRRPGVDWPSQSDSTPMKVNEQGRSAGARRQRRQRPDGLDREVGRAGVLPTAELVDNEKKESHAVCTSSGPRRPWGGTGLGLLRFVTIVGILQVSRAVVDQRLSDETLAQGSVARPCVSRHRVGRLTVDTSRCPRGQGPMASGVRC